MKFKMSKIYNHEWNLNWKFVEAGITPQNIKIFLFEHLLI